MASSGRLYSFGSGDNGQLGNNKGAKVNSPVLVHMTWAVGGSKVKTMPCEIHRIASGGDQCYVLTAEKVSDVKDK